MDFLKVHSVNFIAGALVRFFENRISEEGAGGVGEKGTLKSRGLLDRPCLRKTQLQESRDRIVQDRGQPPLSFEFLVSRTRAGRSARGLGGSSSSSPART